jgi:NAD(P)-dependent dehydrogenase (short-subunit alcohol dehydrogenase family)
MRENGWAVARAAGQLSSRPLGAARRSDAGLKPEVVLVTGADNGIGFHMAKSLLEDGFRVAAIDLSSENLVNLMALAGHCLRPFVCDVRDHYQVRRVVAQVADEWGPVDILVNNAALALFRLFEEKALEDTRTEFEVNYFGYLNMILAVLPGMKARGRGIIHNVGSGVGITGFPGIYGYASTKGAIEALSRTLRLEFAGYGIAVTIMHPPLTNTNSAAPLGVPSQVMADPAKVGRGLARKIRWTKAVVTPDAATTLGLLANRLFPTAMGEFLAKMTERARKGGA